MTQYDKNMTGNTSNIRHGKIELIVKPMQLT